MAVTNPYFLHQAAEALTVDFSQEMAVVEPTALRRVLAHALLHAEPEAVVDALGNWSPV